MESKYILDLKSYIDARETALVGRDHGEDTLKKINEKGVEFSKLESDYEIIEIIVPGHIMSINKSFFLGMFEVPIIRLGKDKFNEKYHFITTEYIKQKIDKSIDAALLNATQGDILDVHD